jgi:hypothetical protein
LGSQQDRGLEPRLNVEISDEASEPDIEANGSAEAGAEWSIVSEAD